MIRSPLGLKRFANKARRLQAAYAEQRAAWEREHPKAVVTDKPSNLSIAELKGSPK